jgi:hypothetical protein
MFRFHHSPGEFSGEQQQGSGEFMSRFACGCCEAIVLRVNGPPKKCSCAHERS